MELVQIMIVRNVSTGIGWLISWKVLTLKKAFFTHLKTMTDSYPIFSQEFDW